MENKYVLKKAEYYVSDITVNEGKLVNFTIDSDYRKLYDDFELAEEDRKLIFIELGLDFVVKKFKEEEWELC